MKNNAGETHYATDALIIGTLAVITAWLFKLGHHLRAEV